jgi:hypothetical protein
MPAPKPPPNLPKPCRVVEGLVVVLATVEVVLATVEAVTLEVLAAAIVPWPPWLKARPPAARPPISMVTPVTLLRSGLVCFGFGSLRSGCIGKMSLPSIGLVSFNYRPAGYSPIPMPRQA